MLNVMIRESKKEFAFDVVKAMKFVKNERGDSHHDFYELRRVKLFLEQVLQEGDWDKKQSNCIIRNIEILADMLAKGQPYDVLEQAMGVLENIRKEGLETIWSDEVELNRNLLQRELGYRHLGNEKRFEALRWISWADAVLEKAVA